jgi:general secretion pathway protein D
MKHLSILISLATLAWHYGLMAAEQAPGPQPAPAQASTNTVKEAVEAKSSEAPPPPPNEAPPGPPSTNQPPPTAGEPGAENSDTSGTDTNSTEGLRLNFRNASLEQVLNYLSDAAGFIIVLEAQPKGKVDVWSNQPLTRDEAVDLLNSVLKKNNYAAIRNGRTLTIVNRDEAKTHDIPVRYGADPEAIPKTDEIVTQIIPVRFVEVAQLIKDLQPLVSTTSTTMTADDSANAIIITDTQANIHKVAEVIKAIDAGAEDVTVVRVFHLKHADPSETSDLLSSLFPDDSRTGNNQAPIQFGGPGGFRRFFGGGGGGGGGGGNAGNNSQNQRLQKRHRVIAVAEPRTSSMVVSAARDLMDQIEDVVRELDDSDARKQTVHVYRLDNAEPSQAMQVLQDIFQKNNQQNTRNTTLQNNPMLTRSTTQSQQNSSSRNSILQGGRGVGVGGGFGQ